MHPITATAPETVVSDLALLVDQQGGSDDAFVDAPHLLLSSPFSSELLTFPSKVWTRLHVVPQGLSLRLDRSEALELLAVVQATLNAIARSRELSVGAAILSGIREKLIDALESDT